jgi:hypothetical protein
MLLIAFAVLLVPLLGLAIVACLIAERDAERQSKGWECHEW